MSVCMSVASDNGHRIKSCLLAELLELPKSFSEANPPMSGNNILNQSVCV